MSEPVRLAGRYELIGYPVRGSMGELYCAYDIHLDREVAVKVIHRDLLTGDLEAEAVRRFRREARLLARAAHPGIPAVHDFGHDGGRDFVVMELVDGATLGDLINEIVPIPIEWVAFIAAQIGVILAWTHQQSLIHRDLKPDNVVLRADGIVKIVDFGTAIASDGLSSRLTPPGTTAGDASYLAPERHLGVSTPRTDLYAVGRVLQEMLRHHPSVPTELDLLVADLTHDLPQRRPAGAAEIERRVRPLLGPLPPLPGFVNRPLASPVRQHAELVARLTVSGVDSGSNQITPRTDFDIRRVRARAEEYARDGRYSSAIQMLEDAIGQIHDPSESLLADLHRDLATVLVEAGDTTRAITACQNALVAMQRRLPVDHPAVLALLLKQARAYAALGDTEAAVDLYLMLLDERHIGVMKLVPQAVVARHELAVQYAASGEYERATTLLERLADDLAADRDGTGLAATEAILGMIRFSARPYRAS